MNLHLEPRPLFGSLTEKKIYTYIYISVKALTKSQTPCFPAQWSTSSRQCAHLCQINKTASSSCCKSTVLQLQGCPCQNKTPVWPKGKVLHNGCSWRKCLLMGRCMVHRVKNRLDRCRHRMMQQYYDSNNVFEEKTPWNCICIAWALQNSRDMTHCLDSKQQPLLFAEHKAFSL